MPQKRLKQSEINQLCRAAKLFDEIHVTFKDDAAKAIADSIRETIEHYDDDKPEEPAKK